MRPPKPTGAGVLVLAGLLVPAATRGQVLVDPNAAGPLHDGRSWDTAFLTVTEGLAAAGGPDDQVWVADGVYFEAVVVPADVQVFGGFEGAGPGGYETRLEQRDFRRNRTVLDAGFSGSVVTLSVGAEIDGLHLVQGAGTLVGARRWGGGVYGVNLGPSGAVRNCVLKDNRADNGGGMSLSNSAPQILANRIEGNSAVEGGGLALWSDSDALIANNIIRANQAATWGGGISIHFGPAPLVVNNTVYGNSAGQDGGGVYVREAATPLLANNLVVANQAGFRGGGLFSCFGSHPTSIHNNYWGNTPGDILFCGQFTQEGDVSRDPLFAAPGAGNFRLLPPSPSIDAGRNSFAQDLTRDFAGQPRFRDGNGDGLVVVDHGAYELFAPLRLDPAAPVR